MRLSGAILGGALLLMAGCANMPAQAVGPAEPGTPKQLQARQIIVTLAPATPKRWAHLTQALQVEYQLRQVGAFPLTSLGVQCLVFQVPEDRSIAAVLARLAADPRVDLAQLNQVFEGLRAAHSDPYAPLQYGAQVIRADAAHRSSTGRRVKVAVVDTGVDKDHPDLRGQIVQTANFVDGGERSFTQDRHGTAVAGVIAARADDGVGIFGIAPQAELLAVKACWHSSPKVSQALCSSWTLAKAVDFVINAGVQVLNMSLAGPPDPLLTRLLTTALARGIPIVAAVPEGEGRELGFPASLESVIAVVASDAQGQVRPSLGGKDRSLVAAPGTEVLTTGPREAYDFLSGSSLAAAHVTGIVALLLEQRPDLSPREVLQLLKTTARAGSTTPLVGIVDACAALGKLLGASACP
jgi:subtilisin family serine protease